MLVSRVTSASGCYFSRFVIARSDSDLVNGNVDTVSAEQITAMRGTVALPQLRYSEVYTVLRVAIASYGMRSIIQPENNSET